MIDHLWRGHDIGPDGRTYVASAVVFKRSATLNPQACNRTGAGSATTGMTGIVRLECF